MTDQTDIRAYDSGGLHYYYSVDLKHAGSLSHSSVDVPSTTSKTCSGLHLRYYCHNICRRKIAMRTLRSPMMNRCQRLQRRRLRKRSQKVDLLHLKHHQKLQPLRMLPRPQTQYQSHRLSSSVEVRRMEAERTVRVSVWQMVQEMAWQRV